MTANVAFGWTPVIGPLAAPFFHLLCLLSGLQPPTTLQQQALYQEATSELEADRRDNSRVVA